MSIQGNLATLELADLLQLLSQGGKTGALIVDNGRVEKKIYFDRGVITCAASTDPREHLSRYLVRRAIIDQATLRRAEALQETRPISLGKSLVELGAITEAELLKVVRLKVEESCYELFRWTDGHFRFNADEHPSIELVPLSISVTGVVMEGMVQLDNWNGGQDDLSFKDEASIAQSPPRQPTNDDQEDGATTLIAPLASIRHEQLATPTTSKPANKPEMASPPATASAATANAATANAATANAATATTTKSPPSKPAAQSEPATQSKTAAQSEPATQSKTAKPSKPSPKASTPAPAPVAADPAADGEVMFGSFSTPTPAAARSNMTIGIVAALMVAAIAVLAIMLSRGGTASSSGGAVPTPVSTDPGTLGQSATPATVDGSSAPTDAEVQAMESKVAELVASRSEQLEDSYKAKYDAELEAMRRQLEQARQESAARRSTTPTPPPPQAESTPPTATETVGQVTLPTKPKETPTAVAAASPGQSLAQTATPAESSSTPATTAPEAVQPETVQPETVQPKTVQPETVQPAATAETGGAARFGDLVEPGPGVEAPSLERELQPRYPENARRTNRSATVLLRALVSESGKVLTLDPIGGEVGFGFDRAAADAAKRSKWKPATKDGVAVKMWVTLKIDFKP